jgi:hypothetical protein
MQQQGLRVLLSHRHDSPSQTRDRRASNAPRAFNLVSRVVSGALALLGLLNLGGHAQPAIPNGIIPPTANNIFTQVTNSYNSAYIETALVTAVAEFSSLTSPGRFFNPSTRPAVNGDMSKRNAGRTSVFGGALAFACGDNSVFDVVRRLLPLLVSIVATSLALIVALRRRAPTPTGVHHALRVMPWSVLLRKVRLQLLLQ